MALFRCCKCKSVYEDYYPPDDTCCKCGCGTIRIFKEATAMTINRLMYWCEECQAYTYNDEDHNCAICNTERE